MSRSLVVVSNAPCLVGCCLGEIIDSFDEVVRFNSFSTAGFERDVGAKTTIWSRMYRVDKLPKLQPGVRKLSREYRKDAAKAKGVLGCELIPDSVNGFYRRAISQSQAHVSSGLLVIAYLLDEFAVVHTAGFYKSALEQAAFAKHYWQPKRKGPFPKGHNPLSEKALYETWVAAGRVIELPLPDEDNYGYQDCWRNPCSIRLQQVPWQTPGPYCRHPDDSTGVSASNTGKDAQPGAGGD